MTKKILVLTMGMLIFFGHRLSFGEEEKIDPFEVIITGKDKSIFKEEEKEEKKALEEIDKKAEKEAFFDRQEKEKLSHLTKEKTKEGEKREEEKEKRFTSSSFTLSYGTFETLFYEHLFGQQTRSVNYLLKMSPGNKSSGFSHGERIFDEYNRNAFDLKAKTRLKDKVGLEGSFGFYEERRSLPYFSSAFDAKKAEGINFSLGSKFFFSPMTELVLKGTFSDNSFSLLQNEKEKEEENARILGVDLKLNTLWQKKFPIYLNAEIFREKLKQEYQVSSIYIAANRLKTRPVVINAKVGWDHRDKNPSISRGGFLIEALYPYREKVLFFARSERKLNNPTSTTLYLKKDYVQVNEELRPEEILDISLGASYRLSALSSIGLTLFGKEVKDFIVWEDKNDTEIKLFEPVNILKEANFWGASCELKYHLSKELIYQAKYTYTKAENKDKEKVIPHLPKQHLLTSLRYLSQRNYEVVLSYELVGSRYSKEDSKEKDLPAYSLLSLKMSKGITDSLSLFLEGRNLLDEDEAYKWSQDYPLRGREIEAGVKVKF